MAQQGVGSRHVSRGQGGCDPEKTVHQCMNGLGAPSGRPRCGHRKIHYDPSRTGRGATGEFLHDNGQLLRRETVEEKAGHDGIVFSCRRPWEDVGFHPVDFCRRAGQSRACASQHFFAALDAGEFGVGKFCGAGFGKFAVSFADAQNAPAIAQFPQPCRSRPLQPLTGSQRFHPIVMRSQQVEAHVRRGARRFPRPQRRRRRRLHPRDRLWREQKNAERPPRRRSSRR